MTRDLEIVRDLDHWRRRLDSVRAGGATVGLVPTMGALHGGHLSLIRRAAAECDVVAVTDYVNPLQFGPSEDLAAYPRDLERDVRLAAEAGAVAVLAPTPRQMWPDGPAATTVRVAGLSDRFEGAARPTHFDGVATIVAKLLAVTGPCRAYFGEKDFQQLAVISRLVTDLSLPADIVGCPTVRDTDGLALSSRNAYLSADERAVAPQLYWALLAGKRAIEDDGIADPAAVAEVMVGALGGHESGWTLGYAAAVDPSDLSTPTRLQGDVRLLIAAHLGRIRLIDNVAATAAPADNVAATAALDREGATA